MRCHRNDELRTDISGHGVFDQPETAFEMVNKYGTYNIQPTADTKNLFPQISHGLPGKAYVDKTFSDDEKSIDRKGVRQSESHKNRRR